MGVYNSKFCDEKYLDLKHSFSLREFMVIKENVDTLTFVEAAGNLNEHKERKKQEARQKNGKRHN